MPLRQFTHIGMPYRVLHGAGCINFLEEELHRLKVNRVLFCCTKSRVGAVKKLGDQLGNIVVGICDAAKIFVPIEVAEKGRSMASDERADCLISYGGGTAVGLAKSIALELDIPFISIVTTYSGSETTALQGIIGQDGVRTNYRSMRMLAKTLFYDPELTLDLPLDVSIASGFNSISHAVSSFLGKTANPVADMYSEHGIRTMSSALVNLAKNTRDIEARSDALHGAWLCGMTLMSSGTTIHHKIAHVLGGGFNLPHGPTHGIILPHSTSYNRNVAKDAMRGIARAFDVPDSDAPQALFDLLGKSGAVSALQDLGMAEAALDDAADRIMVDQYFNLRDYDRDAIRLLLQDAWEGNPPSGV